MKPGSGLAAASRLRRSHPVAGVCRPPVTPGSGSPAGRRRGSSARIEFELMENKTVTIELTDITGRQIQTLFSGNQSTGKHTIDIDGQKLNLSKGAYIVLFSNGENIYHKRVVKFE